MTFFIKKLSLTQFRNYTSSRIQCDAPSVVLTGPNGAGKTNILEAVSLLSPGRGLRRAHLDNLKNKNAPPFEYWAISSTLMTPTGALQIGTGQKTDQNPSSKNGSHKSRVIRIDGIDQKSQASLGEVSAMVWLIPQMDGLFISAPTHRRRFLDQMVRNFDPQHTTRLNTYTKLLRERSQILKSNRNSYDKTWVSGLEQQIAEQGIAIAAHRHSFCERLMQAIDRIDIHDDQFPKPRINIQSKIDDYLKTHSAAESEDFFKHCLEQSREADSFTGGAAEGPHKSDLQVYHNALNMAAGDCSTGEQKGLLIRIILAQASLIKAERGFPPLLLLDDIAAFIDQNRRHILFQAILGLNCQCWMTGTNPEDFSSLMTQAQFFEVSNGTILSS